MGSTTCCRELYGVMRRPILAPKFGSPQRRLVRTTAEDEVVEGDEYDEEDEGEQDDGEEKEDIQTWTKRRTRLTTRGSRRGTNGTRGQQDEAF